MKTEIKIVILSIILFVFVCFIDAVFLYLEYPEKSIWDALIFGITGHVIVHRIIITATFLIFGLIAAAALNKHRKAEEAAKRAKNDWERTFDSIQDLVAIIDVNHTIVRMNRAMADRLKITPEEAIGKHCYKLVHQCDFPYASCPHDAMIADGKHHELEAYEKNLGGTYIFDVSPIHDDQGRLTGSVHIARDISKRKIMEEMLEKSERLYRTLFESAGDSIFLLDLEGNTPGKIVSANQTAALMHGYTFDELLNMTVFDLDTEESAKKGPQRLANLLKGETLKEEATHQRKDGTVFPVEINSRPLQLGDHAYCIAIDRDITDRKTAEFALKASEERMRILIEFSPIGIRVARKGSYIYANPAFARMFGYDNPDEIIGLPVTSLYIPEERELIRKLAKGRPIGSQAPSYYEVTGQTKDGKRLDLTIWVAKIDFDGEPATLGFVVDVSSEKSLRAQLTQAQKMESLGSLAGGIAHDFNNLLQVVIGYSEMMISYGKISEKVKSDLGKINQAAQDGADLAKRLLAFSRKVEIDKRYINLNDRMQRIKGMLSRTIPKTIEIILGPADDLKMVNADPTQVDQILLNLAINARDAMPDGGRLTISTANVTLDEVYCRSHVDTVPGDYVLLMVSDTGQGMDKYTLEHIFEPFFTTKGEGKGTGLGLSIVYGVIKQHDGFIECSSKLSEGTTFKIYLPAISEQANGLEKAVMETQVKGATETILLVDDSESVRDLGVRLFSEAGYTVITAENGINGIEVFRRERAAISLTIIDIIMPQMDGVKCLEEIIKIDSTAKVLIATGFTVDEATQKIIESLGKGFIRKPFNLKDALRTVRAVLDSD